MVTLEKLIKEWGRQIIFFFLYYIILCLNFNESAGTFIMLYFFVMHFFVNERSNYFTNYFKTGKITSKKSHNF